MTDNTVDNLILQRVCRICLKSDYPLRPVFDSIVPQFDAPPIAVIELWRLFGDILISKNETFPDSICHTCYDDVQNTYIFLLKCEKAEAILKQIKQFNFHSKAKIEYDPETRKMYTKPWDLSSKHDKTIKSTNSNQNDSFKNIFTNNPCEIKDENDDNISGDSVLTAETNDEEIIVYDNGLEETANEFNSNMTSFVDKGIALKCKQCSYTCLSDEKLVQHNYRNHIASSLDNSMNSYESDGSECRDIIVDDEAPALNRLGLVRYDRRFARRLSAPTALTAYNIIAWLLNQSTTQRSTIWTKLLINFIQESENTDFVLSPLPSTTHLPVNLAKPEPSTSDANDETKNQTPHFVKYINRDGKVLKVWECGICFRNFQHQYTLMRHLPTHTNVRNFVCNECGKAFRQLSTLSQHRAIHSVERPYACETCNKSFNRISTLISHRKTHSDYKPFRCNMCHKGFHQKGNLRNHIYIHTNERPYRCTVCNKGFNQMSNLVCHTQKSHSTEFGSVWTCHRCNMSFSKRTLLRAHELETHHIQGPTLKSNRTKAASGRKASTTSMLDDTKISESDSASVEYCKSEISENGILIPAIDTEAMKIARTNKEMPFAVLHFFEGTPLLVRIIDHGNQSFLRPTQSEDFISLKSQNSGQPEKVSVPIVAAVYQTLNVSGRPDFKVMPPKNIYKFINQHQAISVNGDSNGQAETKVIRSEEIPTGNVISLTPPQIPSDLRDVTGNLMTPLFESLNSVKDEPTHIDESGPIEFGGSGPMEDKQRGVAVVVESSDWWKKQNRMDCYDEYDGFSEAFQNIATGGLLAPKRVIESEIKPDQNASILDISARNPLLCHGQMMPEPVNYTTNDNFSNFNIAMMSNDHGSVSSILHAFRNEGMDTNIVKSLFSENPNLLDDINECLSEILP